MYQKLLIPLPACKCSSSSPLQSQMSFCQYLAQVTADGVCSARSWGLRWGHSQLHGSSDCWFHAFISALQLSCSSRDLLAVLQVGRGRSRPLARHSVGLTPLSVQSWARVWSWWHSSLHMLVLSACYFYIGNSLVVLNYHMYEMFPIWTHGGVSASLDGSISMSALPSHYFRLTSNWIW